MRSQRRSIGNLDGTFIVPVGEVLLRLLSGIVQRRTDYSVADGSRIAIAAVKSTIRSNCIVAECGDTARATDVGVDNIPPSAGFLSA